MDKGILLIVSGFAGSGKGTVMKRLIADYDNYALSVSATTRNPRPGEENGREYFFKTKEEFETMVENGELLEHACYVGNYYGTPKAYVDKMLDEGKDVILEIEIQGGLQVKEKCPEALLIFMMPPSVEEIYNRLKKRGTEDEATISKRMKRASEEIEEVAKYDFVMINDDLDECVRNIHELVKASKWSTLRRSDIINTFKSEFVDFLKK